MEVFILNITTMDGVVRLSNVLQKKMTSSHLKIFISNANFRFGVYQFEFLNDSFNKSRIVNISLATFGKIGYLAMFSHRGNAKGHIDNLSILLSNNLCAQIIIIF